MKTVIALAVATTCAACVMSPQAINNASNDELCFQTRGVTNRQSAQIELAIRNVSCGYMPSAPSVDNTGLALQLLRPPQPAQQPFLPPPQVCRSRWVGNQVETVCN